MISAAGLLTQTADYDTPGSWGPASNGWPGIRGDAAYAMYVFANCVESIPYGSYVLMDQAGHYGAKESYLRVRSDYIDKLKADFETAGRPSVAVSVLRRDVYGKLNPATGLHGYAPLWTEEQP